MKIVGGRYKGQHLHTPKGGLRPTSDRTRESIFNMLAPVIENTPVLELFAGTGALGFEALSQGAASCTLVELQPLHVKAIKANAAMLLKEESHRARVVQADVSRWLKNPQPAGPYAIVIADPPYEEANDWLPKLLEILPAQSLLNDIALLVFEGHKQTDPVEAPGWSLIRDRRYGLTRIHLYRYDRSSLPTESTPCA